MINGLVALFILVVLLFYRLRVQEVRLRVLMAFVAGLFDRVVKHGEAINGISRDSARQLFKDSPEYQFVIDSIAAYFEEDYWSTPFKKFLLSRWNLFIENGMANGGFDHLHKDFFVYLAKQVLNEESSLFSKKEKQTLELLVKKNEELDAKQRDDLLQKPSSKSGTRNLI